MQSFKKDSIKVAKLVIVALVLTAGINYLFADTWNAPTGVPPTGNVSTPINVGSLSQTKSGPLVLQGALQLASGAVSGGILTSDASGNATWQLPAPVLTGELDYQGPCTNKTLGNCGDIVGVNTTPDQSFVLSGTTAYKVAVTGTYFSCNDYTTSLEVDDSVVSTYAAAQGNLQGSLGGGSDSSGCNEDIILASVILQPGNHTLSFQRNSSDTSTGKNGIQEAHFLWTAFPVSISSLSVSGMSCTLTATGSGSNGIQGSYTYYNATITGAPTGGVTPYIYSLSGYSNNGNSAQTTQTISYNGSSGVYTTVSGASPIKVTVKSYDNQTTALSCQ